MDIGTLCSQVNDLFAARQYDAIIQLLYENKETANHDNILATVFFLCFIHNSEKDAGENSLFSKVSTLDELLERYTRLKFLLCRLDFGISVENQSELYQFLCENNVSSLELDIMVNYSVIHKDQVWEKIKNYEG